MIYDFIPSKAQENQIRLALNELHDDTITETAWARNIGLADSESQIITTRNAYIQAMLDSGHWKEVPFKEETNKAEFDHCSTALQEASELISYYASQEIIEKLKEEISGLRGLDLMNEALISSKDEQIKQLMEETRTWFENIKEYKKERDDAVMDKERAYRKGWNDCFDRYVNKE